MRNPLVSIVIPTYNRKDSLLRLINSILLSKYKNLEIIIVDDASIDNTFEEVKKKYKNNKKIKIFRNKKNIFAAGSKNVGLDLSKGELIAFIDDDNVVDKFMINNLVEAFNKFPELGEAAPINYDFNNKDKLILTRSTRNMWTSKTKHLRTLDPFKKMNYWEADDAPNAFMVRSKILKKYKIKFDSSYGIMYEESDFAYRIKKAGYKIMVFKDAIIYHDINKITRNEKPKDYMYHFMTDKRRAYTFARNRIIFHNKNSTKLQNISILSFWIWFFALYYSFKFIFYNGFGNFNLRLRLLITFYYFRGIFNGLRILLP